MRSSSSCCSSHDRSALASGRGGDGRRRSGSSGRMRTRVRVVGRGRGRSPHPGYMDVSSACLSHVWAREGKEMERVGGGVFLF